MPALAVEKTLETSPPPFNIWLFDIDAFVDRTSIRPITTPLVMEPGTTKFHPEGLYSEEIFGPVGHKRRMATASYINLNTKVLQPKLFINLMRLAKGYERIISRQDYAVFDPKTGTFRIADREEEGAGTGYQFFMSHLLQVRFPHTNSLSRQDKIKAFERYAKVAFIDKYRVLPAALRDYQISPNGRPTVDEVNKFYVALISLSNAIPPGMGSNPMFDDVRYGLQRKLVDLYEHLTSIVAGSAGNKNGYASRKWGSRNISLGGRDVITSADLSVPSLKDPRLLKHDTVRVPLFLAAKQLEPRVIYSLRRVFLSHIMSSDTEQLALIDPKTLAVGYHPVNPAEKDVFLTPEGLTKFINSFKDMENRRLPVTMTSAEGKVLWLYLVHDDGKRVFIFRNIDSFKDNFAQVYPDGKIDLKLVRPLTRLEMVTIATWMAALGRFDINTRYPVAGDGSTFPARIQVATTDPSRVVELASEFDQQGLTIPNYPILDRPFIDGLVIHPYNLKDTGADYDGDKLNSSPVLAEESCQEIDAHLNSPRAFLRADGQLNTYFNTDLLTLMVHALMKPPEPGQ